jgi:hypothetical protein
MTDILLLVFKSNGQHYIEATLNYNFAAYHSTDEIMERFKGFVDAMKMDYTWRNSATIGLMQMAPCVIKAPEDISSLNQYITEHKVIKVSGGAIGAGYIGVPVSENVLELKIDFNINRTILEIADNENTENNNGSI